MFRKPLIYNFFACLITATFLFSSILVNHFSHFTENISDICSSSTQQKTKHDCEDHCLKDRKYTSLSFLLFREIFKKDITIIDNFYLTKIVLVEEKSNSPPL